MFSSIDPVYVVILLLAAAGGGAWYVRKMKNKTPPGKIGIEEVEVGNPITNETVGEEAIPDKLAQDEPDVAKLSNADLKVVEPKTTAVTPRQEELELPMPAPEPERDLTEDIKPRGHRLARIDTGVEAVLRFTPTDTPAFDAGRLLTAEKTAKSVELPFPLQLSFFSAKTGLWTDDATSAEDCREFYVSVLTANSRKKLDSLEVSRFLGLADRLGIDLAADVEAPDADRILATADKVSRIAERFSQYLTFKLVGARDIEDSAFNEAALGCGFVYSEGHYEKRDAGGADPLIVLGRMPQLKNELGLGINIPLTNPAAKPLTELCAVANDLACRLDLELTDPYGAPVTAASASAMAHQLEGCYREMATVGVPAGSPRARRIFSAA